MFVKGGLVIENMLDIVGCFYGQGGVKVCEKDMIWCMWFVDKWLEYVLVNGIIEFIDEDIEEVCLLVECLLYVIEGLLMVGMNVVGDLFGSGKMFLFQVVKLVWVMKQVVVYLFFYMEVEKVGGGVFFSVGKVLMVMVKGDVYDIGKNIVGVVLVCNNYEIIDLGVMVLISKIFEVVKVENVDIIGLLGLIILFLDEMVYVVSEMECEGFDILLLIGGVMISWVYMVVKIYLKYVKGQMVYVIDVSCVVGVVGNFLLG